MIRNQVCRTRSVIPHQESEKVLHNLLSENPHVSAALMYLPCSEAVTEDLVPEAPEELTTDLIEIHGEDIVRHRIGDLARYASDASPYGYISNVILRPKNIGQVRPFFDIALAKVAMRPSGPAAPA